MLLCFEVISHDDCCALENEDEKLFVAEGSFLLTLPTKRHSQVQQQKVVEKGATASGQLFCSEKAAPPVRSALAPSLESPIAPLFIFIFTLQSLVPCVVTFNAAVFLHTP